MNDEKRYQFKRTVLYIAHSLWEHHHRFRSVIYLSRVPYQDKSNSIIIDDDDDEKFGATGRDSRQGWDTFFVFSDTHSIICQRGLWSKLATGTVKRGAVCVSQLSWSRHLTTVRNRLGVST